MLLKSLELHGFKSFPDRTKLNFSQGITAVVGPNGSGKSNISDAVRWVLGEMSNKTLRSSKMEDVIFGGTQTRKAQGFAEVSLTIGEAREELGIDSDEITVTRKYYRSGESEYLINGSQVRLKDITELFMDTGLGRDGYSLVGQGRIAEIVSAKSNERREIFEEAAGISKFRYRKEESERRLAAAQENLLRLLDILEELEGRIGPLKNQSEKARQFLTFAEEKKRLEISHWVYTLGKCNTLLREQQDKILIASQQSEEIEKQVGEIEVKIQHTYELMQGYMALSEELRAKKQTLDEENSQSLSQKAVWNNDIEHHRSEIHRLEEEIEGLSQSQEDMKANVAQRRAAADAKQEEITAIEAKLASCQTELDAILQQADQMGETVRALNESLNRFVVQQSEYGFEKNTLQQTLEEAQRTIQNADAVREEKNNALAAVKAEHASALSWQKELTEEIDGLNNSIRGYELKLENRAKKLEVSRKEVVDSEQKIRQREQKKRLLEDLEQNMEGFAGSVRQVLSMSKSGRLRGILGSVAQLISVQDTYSIAIETALGAALQNIITADEAAAKSAILALKEQRAGRATFLPLNTVKGRDFTEKGLQELDGFVAMANDLVTCDAKYDGVVKSLLGRTAVATDLDSAVVIARKYNFRFRIVTLDGQVVNAGGSMTGGSATRNQGILSRRHEIDALEQQIAQLREKHRTLTEGQTALEAEVAKLEAQVGGIHAEIRTNNEDFIRCEGEVKRLEEAVAAAQQQFEQWQQGLADNQNRVESTQVRIAELDALLTQISGEKETCEAQLAELEGNRSESVQTRERLSEEMSHLRVQKAELQKGVESDLEFAEVLEQRRTDSKQSLIDLNGKIEALEKEIDSIAKRITEIDSDCVKRQEESDRYTHEIAQALQQRQEQEGVTTKLREEERRISQEKESVIRDLTRLEEQKVAIQKQYDDIIGKMWEEYEMTRSQAEELAEPVEDVLILQKDLAKVKNQIKALGTVNLAAIEEYKEVSERYELLRTQVDDVERSKAELTKLIADLTENMRELFAESFAKINQNFSQIFVELFGGGKASLSLSDPDNILESGIDIHVQPPGKLIKNLASLSGGEQAFVAIAIYFAILKVRPSPFCILDEIEAALDDVNVGKYAGYLRQLCDKSQFILITHRRGSMEEADVLYGVTMQQEGVSKLLSLNVKEAQLTLSNQT